MSALFYCEQCGSPLLTSLGSDKQSIQSAFLMSYIAMKGNGYALNVCRQGKGCPICGKETPWIGNPPPKIGQTITCEGRLGDEYITFLKGSVKYFV